MRLFRIQILHLGRGRRRHSVAGVHRTVFGAIQIEEFALAVGRWNGIVFARNGRHFIGHRWHQHRTHARRGVHQIVSVVRMMVIVSVRRSAVAHVTVQIRLLLLCGVCAEIVPESIANRSQIVRELFGDGSVIVS